MLGNSFNRFQTLGLLAVGLILLSQSSSMQAQTARDESALELDEVPVLIHGEFRTLSDLNARPTTGPSPAETLKLAIDWNEILMENLPELPEPREMVFRQFLSFQENAQAQIKDVTSKQEAYRDLFASWKVAKNLILYARLSVLSEPFNQAQSAVAERLDVTMNELEKQVTVNLGETIVSEADLTLAYVRFSQLFLKSIIRGLEELRPVALKNPSVKEAFLQVERRLGELELRRDGFTQTNAEHELTSIGRALSVLASFLENFETRDILEEGETHEVLRTAAEIQFSFQLLHRIFTDFSIFQEKSK